MIHSVLTVIEVPRYFFQVLFFWSAAKNWSCGKRKWSDSFFEFPWKAYFEAFAISSFSTHLCWTQKLWLALSFLLFEQPHVQLHIPMSTWLFSLQLRISPGVDFADEGNVDEPQLFTQPEQSIYLSWCATSVKIKHKWFLLHWFPSVIYSYASSERVVKRDNVFGASSFLAKIYTNLLNTLRH